MIDRISNARFPGPQVVKISVPDPEDADWKLPFVRISSGQLLDDMVFNPKALEIRDQRLKIFVDNVNSGHFHPLHTH